MSPYRLGPAVLGLVLGAAFWCDAGELESFPFYKDVQRADAPGEEILAVTLDSDVYAACRDGFGDLRVVDPAGQDVPYRIEKGTETRNEVVRRPSPGKVVSLTENDDNSIEIVVELDRKVPSADGLVFQTPLKDFERKVSVFGSTDGTEWEPLVTDAVLFDYTRYMDVRNREIKLPKNNHRSYRAVIEEVTDRKEWPLMDLSRRFEGDTETERTERTKVESRPLRIDRIEPWHNTIQKRLKQQKKADFPIVEFSTEENAKEKETIIHVRTRREPLTRFTLETPSANFSRAASVQVPVERGINTEWVDVGSATVSAVRFRGFDREELDIGFPQQRQEEYRIVVKNRDNRSLEISGVAAEGDVYEATFFADADTEYQLYYGSESAEAPSYDTAALAVTQGKGFQPLAAPLGPQADNAQFGGAPTFQAKEFLNNPLTLGVVICLMVVVLALVLFRAGRRIEELPSE